MSGNLAFIRKPQFLLSVVMPIALITEFLLLEISFGITLPSDRGSAVSTYEIREKGQELHFITETSDLALPMFGARTVPLGRRSSFASQSSPIDRMGLKATFLASRLKLLMAAM